MIDINLYLKKNQTEIKNIIQEFDVNTEFSSHDFIEIFSQKHEVDYIEMLTKYKNSGNAFQNVHKIIAKYLSLNKDFFNIEKTHKRRSENVHGKTTTVHWWKKLEK